MLQRSEYFSKNLWKVLKFPGNRLANRPATFSRAGQYTSDPHNATLLNIDYYELKGDETFFRIEDYECSK